MRRTVGDQLPLLPASLAHEHARELEAVGAILDAHPEFAKWVQSDLLAGAAARLLDPASRSHGPASVGAAARLLGAAARLLDPASRSPDPAPIEAATRLLDPASIGAATRLLDAARRQHRRRGEHTVGDREGGRGQIAEGVCAEDVARGGIDDHQGVE